ncbi:MAG: enoyl-CoA hydratase/isomerase family protein [Natronospirillum sp.]|uniref:enoyl-CoA hydratase/isomerase family protein n=1 Tax=Natronospirillum sp. TaxID=2812955 RepID=UPI0025FA2F8E|nr:enoyl-CoA hydratase/isomerase family protein [Natronospirillum sp.]MCH8551235.1 enoyl-CoA hydratase/isomerase family protein [Natronospirillum sp.]
MSIGQADKGLVYSELQGDTLRLTLNRPQRHNALVPELLKALNQHLQEAQRLQPRCLVLAAAGRTFSTGGDVQAFYEVPRSQRPAYARALVGDLHEAMLRLIQLPCPVVARVQGMVTGGSCGFLLASDLVAMHQDAHLAPWYTVVGFTPDGGWSTLMADCIGRHRTLAVHLLNRPITAQEAVNWGLADAALPSTEALDKTLADWTAQLVVRAGTATQTTLTRLRPSAEQVREWLDTELEDFVAQIGTAEAERRMQRFLGKTTAHPDEADHGTV